MQLNYEISNTCSFTYDIDILVTRRLMIDIVLNFIHRLTNEVNFDISFDNNDLINVDFKVKTLIGKVFDVKLRGKNIILSYFNHTYTFKCTIESNNSILTLISCQTTLKDKVIYEEYLNHEAIFKIVTDTFLLTVPYESKNQINEEVFACISRSYSIEHLLELYKRYFNINPVTEYLASLKVLTNQGEICLEKIDLIGDKIISVMLGQEIDGIYINLINSEFGEQEEGILSFSGNLGVINSIDINNYKKWLAIRYHNLEERETSLVR